MKQRIYNQLLGHLSGRIFRPLIDAIFWFDPDHCRESFRSEVERRQLPQGYK